VDGSAAGRPERAIRDPSELLLAIDRERSPGGRRAGSAAVAEKVARTSARITSERGQYLLVDTRVKSEAP
jgi:hypothetical protein